MEIFNKNSLFCSASWCQEDHTIEYSQALRVLSKNLCILCRLISSNQENLSAVDFSSESWERESWHFSYMLPSVVLNSNDGTHSLAKNMHQKNT